MSLEATTTDRDFQRVVLEEYPEGVYVLVFKPGEDWPFRDHLQDNWEHAKLHAFEEYGITDSSWHEIPRTDLMR